MKILRGGRIIDPKNGRDGLGDFWIRDGNIAVVEDKIPADAEVIDCQGKWVVPGLIDLHVHLREPGQEYKETIESGCLAAAAGGFTAVCCMPNSKPVNDNAAITRAIVDTAKSCAARVYPAGAVSCGSQGENLAEYAEMKEAGIVAVTDDGRPVENSQLMRRALEYADSHDLPVMSHAEDMSLSRNGCMHEGVVSTRLGLRGIPAAAESIMVFRDAALAELTGARLHICHVSAESSVAVIRAARSRGIKITAETAPHYFTLTDEAAVGYDTNAKMNPPLRSEADREAIRAALADGVLDAIATDHAPHSILEKEVEFNRAANGVIGLETALPLTLALVRDGVITPARLVELMSVNPAAIIGVPGGSLAVGAVADVTIIDPERRWRFTETTNHSKSVNSPFWGWELQGRAVMTMLAGRIAYQFND
ncbi:MAG: dihydroorotase [Desulfobulbaceae bacterium]|nr:dihydroorotase [Desulfobulbaceae bacterium]